jgi:OFA family oxalate/formate antiporter-like MFS transporter
MLTAWGFASAFGPLLIAHLRQSETSYAGGLHIIAGIMAVSILVALIVRPPRPKAAEARPGATR